MKRSVIILTLACFFTASLSFATPIRVGLVLDKGGKDDKSFNAAAYEGASRAEKELGIELKYVETADSAAIENAIRSFARKKMDIIIGVGFVQAEPMDKVAAQFPDVKFAVVDGQAKNKNVRSLLFEEHEGSFLMGAIAAWTSKSGKVGFVGGMDVPLIRRFQMAYNAGVKYANPSAKLTTNYAGVSSDAWNNPPKAKELALGQYQTGVDIIFAAAGASNSGVFDAAEERKKYAIGVDSNQNWMKPGLILTSMLKRVDVAVFNAINDVKNEKFSGGVKRYGLKDAGIDYALDSYNKKIFSAELKKKVESLRKAIIAGKIAVPDYYKSNVR